MEEQWVKTRGKAVLKQVNQLKNKLWTQAELMLDKSLDKKQKASLEQGYSC